MKFAYVVTGAERCAHFMNHSEKLESNFGVEKFQETMYCQEDNECLEGYVYRFLLSTRARNSICCAKR